MELVVDYNVVLCNEIEDRLTESGHGQGNERRAGYDSKVMPLRETCRRQGIDYV